MRTWRGQPVEMLPREELIEAVYDLAARLEVTEGLLNRVETMAIEFLVPPAEES